MMKLKSKLRMLSKVSIPKFLYYNFLSKKVKRKGKGFLIPYRHAVLELDKTSRILLHDGHFRVNYHLPAHSHAEAYVRMSEGTVLEIYDNTSLYYRSTIEMKKNAVVVIGSAQINSGSVILAADRISIGRGVLLAREVFVYDYDHHRIIDEDGNQINLPDPVEIGDHVWIGLKSVVLRGSNIEEGAVIAAGSQVSGRIRAGTLACGNPARSYKEVGWQA